MTRVVIIGGYGGFGGKLSRRLAKSGFEVVVAGRSLEKAEAFCRECSNCRPARADRDQGIADLLAAEEPDLVIDASGPFQTADYRLVEDCIAGRVSYLDLADAREFVTGIGRYDRQAREAGVAVISGASSVPALSGAVVRRLATDVEQVTSVEIAILASARASAGASVTSAILKGVGRPIELRRGGCRATGYGWQELRRERIEIPSGPKLKRQLVALVDIPDHALLPERLAGRPAVTFHAGTGSAIEVMALWLASWPIRRGWIRSLDPVSRILASAHRFPRPWSTDRSGMVVRLFGLAAGKRVARHWSLVAEDGDGPEIPTLAATALARRIADGEITPGAMDAGELLDLEAFEPLFQTLRVTHLSEDIPQPATLYRRVMGEGFDTLPPAVRAMHDVLRDSGASGRARVECGRSPVARLVTKIMRFPPAGDHALHVHFREQDGEERWTRDFAGHRFSSVLSECGDRIVERFGPLRFHFELKADGAGLGMALRRWSLFGLPLPLALAPRSPAREWEEDGRFHFDVPVELPLIGPVIRYRGWLEPPR